MKEKTRKLINKYLPHTLYLMSIIYMFLGIIMPGLNIYYVTGLIFLIIAKQHEEK